MDAPTMLQLTCHGDAGHVVEVALDRPSAMNAISTAFAEEITATTARLAADPSVRAVVITSTHERAFCVGADLKERNGFTDAQMMDHRLVSKLAYRGVLDLPVPAVAAVEGFALGGGMEIALSCDLIVAGEGATVALPEVGVGVIPGGGGTQLLTRRVGWSRAASMIFTARRLTAAEGGALGVLDEVVPAGTARDRALEIAAQIAANSPVAVRNAKKAMRLGMGADLAAGLEIEDGCWRATAFSGDRKEGVAAFAEKRTPEWPGH
ncbi:enoyl-CoA hydratase/isomerase family protein [Ornithinimicrobium tianjinense]|uniref:enoyl-CoA hydratase n=1 Tax=Ornithinimicrobium tianjinense TaxID=1195761 RepID=A0A917BK09_9MICO|nr:enoyl-CoA hydratase-related protein [Ornithinimicrobium tianjinense]GGF42797.1 enoyl-CoA hydratase [Ornithinimicrobium tianjinense]